MKRKTEEADATLVFHPVPVEYWETCDACQGGLIVSIDEKRLHIHSSVDMRLGAELNITIFLSLGRDFEGVKVSTRIVGKDLFAEGGSEEFEYELEITGISEEDRLKLKDHLQIRRSIQRTYVC